MEPVTTEVVVSWLVIHLCALACAWGTRLCAGTRAESAMQVLFFTALAVVGVAAWFCQHLDQGLWVPSGITLVLMVLTAVSDFRRTHEPARAMHSMR
jgi:Ca2+/H+ antiporter